MEEIKNANMTDAERLKLAEKLDKDLDDFINSLEKKRYTDGWSEENWREEIDKHPFFMKRAPEPGEDVHPMMEGLQQLKFDTDDNSPEELAEKYKEDGTYWMKHKKFRISIMNYTEGILQKFENDDLRANLYNNRSAAQFFLKNYRSSIEDARLALKCKRDYPKVKYRIIKCLLELKKFDEACNEIAEFLTEDPTSVELINFQKEAITKKTEKLRDERKLQMQEKKKRQDFQTLVQAFIERKIKFEGVRDIRELSENHIKPAVPPLENHSVWMDKNGTIHWPVMFCYPEFEISDFHQSLNENESLHECLTDMFAADEEQSHSYHDTNELNIYHQNRVQAKVHKVDAKKPLREVLSDKNFSIYNGYLLFFVIPRDSKAELDFLNEKRKPLIY